MSGICDRIVRRRAEGGALDPAEAAHAAGCERCAAVAALEARLARALGGRDRSAEPDGAFLARVTAGAEERLERRVHRGWRWPAVAGAAVACAALAVVLGGRAWLPGPPAPRAGALPTVVDASLAPPALAPAAAEEAHDDDEALAARLAALSDVEHALARRARWDAILAPVEAAGRLAPGARAPLSTTPTTTRSR